MWGSVHLLLLALHAWMNLCHYFFIRLGSILLHAVVFGYSRLMSSIL